MTARLRFPITTVLAIALVVIGVALAVAFWLWGSQHRAWVAWTLAIVWLLYLLVAVKAVMIMRVIEDQTGQTSFATRWFIFGFRCLNLVIPWHRLPSYPGSLNLLAFRLQLRQQNLHDTAGPLSGRLEWKSQYRAQRSPDGSFNDLERPEMGAAGTRFGRNIPLNRVHVESEPELLRPSPREISRRLMTRDQFLPATSLNLLAAAWIQFQNHDWFNHRRSAERIQIPLKPGDDWPENPMQIRRTEPDATQSPGGTPTFRNTESHWWDASQLYGSTIDIQRSVRSGVQGKLKLDEHGLLPLEDDPQLYGIEKTGFNDNWWVGLSMMHTLFAREHNAICDRLRAENSSWDDEQLFQTARLINAALIAKIHTVEWTPAILGHPALEISMNGNWWGLLGEAYRKAFGRLSESEAISGIMGSHTQHHTAPYYLTEEFVSVYRLHPLIPDDYVFRSHRDHSVIAQKQFMEIQGNETRAIVEGTPLADLFYSFGMMHPGAVTLHNFPRALQNFVKIREGSMDLAAIDVLRDRERGVPKYNDCLELVHKRRVKSFRKLTPNPQWAKELEEVYEGDIDRVDLMVGMYCEPLPRGFGFSDTAFRIFILMASRRLKSDRFYTTDFRPEVYTQTGIDWVNNNSFRSVVKRHFPELTPALQRNDNGFAPWTRVS